MEDMNAPTAVASVLIVDDAKFMRAKLRGILEPAGFIIAGEAENGVQAIEAFRQMSPDIVTMDITMPEMGGLEALKEIRNINGDAVVVMISALGQKDKVRESIVAGASDFILKPFVPLKVVETINRVAARVKRSG